METPGKSGLSPVIPAAIHRAAVMAAPRAARADALSVNKVMKLNTGNKICRGEGLVYDGVASVGGGCSVSGLSVCPPPWSLWEDVTTCLRSKTHSKLFVSNQTN